MSFMTDLIAAIEQQVIAFLESLIAKAEHGGKVTAEDLKSAVNVLKAKLAEARKSANLK